MLTISGITAVAEKARHYFHDVNYSIENKKRVSNIFLFKDQDYASMKQFLQEGRFAFRDSVVLTDDEDIVWIPIERPSQPDLLNQEPKPRFFDDPIENVARYTFKPGRYSGHLFISALSCVSQHRCLLQHLVPYRFEQNCVDVLEEPPADDDESLCSDSDVQAGNNRMGLTPINEGEEEYGQISSYCREEEGELECEDEHYAEDEGPASFGLFRKSYEDNSGAKLGLWDSDCYSSSENINLQLESNDGPQEQPEAIEKFSPQPSSVIENSPHIANKYAGIFRFRFWHNGQWMEVVVDEMLPYSSRGDHEPLYLTAFDSTGQPVRDLWLPLMEKAYAKLLSRYECLSASSGGSIEDFLTDLSGGICETIHLRTSQHRNELGLQASLGHRMRTELYSGRGKKMSGGKIPGSYSILCSIVEPHNPKQEGQVNDNGLIYGRAYPITDVREISFAEVEAWAPNNHTLLMVRLRDPFGPAGWNGPFSRGSPEWLAISPIERIRIGLICETESDFWMPIDAFCCHFTQVTFCRIVNTNFWTVRRQYFDNVVQGSWRSAARMAGGSYENNRETFLRNPQYMFRVEPHHAHVMVSLSQQFIRQDPSLERYSIGFTILHVEENRIYRVHHIPTAESGYTPIIVTTQYRHTGPVFVKLLLYHGRYVIIPTTNEANKNGNFLLRLISTHQCFLRHLNQDIPAIHPLMPYPMCVTRVRVIRASSLQRLDRPTGTINAYCMIWCENHWVRTKTLWHNTDPEWNQSAIFYRRWSATLCVKVVIWHQSPKYWRDQYLGKHIFQAYEETGRPITVSLYGRRRWENNQPRSGVLTVEILSSADVGAL